MSLDNLEVGQMVELMINDEIFIATVYDKSTRETPIEVSTYYTLNIHNKTDWHISLSRNVKKGVNHE